MFAPLDSPVKISLLRLRNRTARKRRLSVTHYNELVLGVSRSSSAPYIITGLRISLSIALILVTTAEMIAGSKGLGFFILDEERSMNSGNMYAGVILVSALGYLLNRLFVLGEGWAMNWRRGMLAREAL